MVESAGIRTKDIDINYCELYSNNNESDSDVLSCDNNRSININKRKRKNTNFYEPEYFVTRTLSKKKKNLVWIRDNKKCKNCSIDVDNSLENNYCHYQIDHIIPIKHGGTDNYDNLQTLCVNCHAIKTKLDYT